MYEGRQQAAMDANHDKSWLDPYSYQRPLQCYKYCARSSQPETCRSQYTDVHMLGRTASCRELTPGRSGHQMPWVLVLGSRAWTLPKTHR
jgi:hypothetical protein